MMKSKLLKRVHSFRHAWLAVALYGATVAGIVLAGIFFYHVKFFFFGAGLSVAGAVGIRIIGRLEIAIACLAIVQRKRL